MSEIKFTKQAAKGLSQIPRHHANAILAKLERIANDDLKGLNIKYFPSMNAWRLRHCNYRAVYEKEGVTMNILVIKVGPRGNVYK